MTPERTRVVTLPDAVEVWAFSDVHGVPTGLLRALVEAGIVDEDGHWVARRTALVGCGDYVDRGADVPGLLELLRRLTTEAASQADGSAVVLARGNHEAMLAAALDGDERWCDVWLGNGGDATLEGFGVPIVAPPDGRAMLAALERRAPWLRAWLRSLADAVRWRDVLFVHAGLVPDLGLADLGERTEDHLWVRESWSADTSGLGLADPRYARYVADGVARVIYGHTPRPAPTLGHGGTSLGIDTNAAANVARPDRSARLSLVRVPATGSLAGARVVTVPTGDAPDRMRDRAGAVNGDRPGSSEPTPVS